MEYVYHGSSQSGLKIIEARISTHREKWVYALETKPLALFFMGKNGSDLLYDISRINKNDIYSITERLPGAFDQIFNNCGSLYYLNRENFKTGQTSWSAELVSNQNEPVIKEEIIPNILEELKTAAAKGEIRLYFYPNRPKWIPSDNSDLIPKIIKWQNNGFTNAITEFLKLYPNLKTKLEKAINKKDS